VQATIHYIRIGNDHSVYTETILHEDALRLVTESILPAAVGMKVANSIRRKNGLIDAGEIITKVRKFHFYQQWFDVIAFYGLDNRLLGYYSDVVTPLEKTDGEYFLYDLVLDLWIYPDGKLVELDWDELEDAVQRGLLTPQQQQKAVETMHWLVTEARKGSFPFQYIQENDQGDSHD
jgi:predicted RNA-binding protein associated with RNAse of E/G family